MTHQQVLNRTSTTVCITEEAIQSKEYAKSMKVQVHKGTENALDGICLS